MDGNTLLYYLRRIHLPGLRYVLPKIRAVSSAGRAPPF